MALIITNDSQRRAPPAAPNIHSILEKACPNSSARANLREEIATVTHAHVRSFARKRTSEPPSQVIASIGCGAFTDFGNLQSAIEDRGLKISESNVEYIPSNTTELSQEDAEEVMKLIARLEGDDDVQKVFYNLR